MSTVKTNNVQIGQSVTATNNFTWYQPASPDGTVRLGNGNSGSVTDLVTLTSAGNLGIGTSSPAGKLDIRGALASSYVIDTTAGSAVSSALYLGVPSVTTYAGLVTDYANDRLYIRHNSATRMTLDSSGNLGLGVTPSAWTTWKPIQVGTLAALSGSSTAAFVSNNFYYDGNGRYISTAAATLYEQSSGVHKWFTAPSGTAGNAISFTQAMTLTASGSLLVGATSGSARFEATAISGQYAGYFSFPSGGYGIGIKNTSGGSGVLAYFFSPNYVGEINTNGTTTTYASASDQRLKTNITPAGSAIQSILDFPVDQFDWISSGEHQDFGAVAQKAINVIPEMVSVPADPDEMWGIDWSKAVPRLIKTIQELTAELNLLKQKVNA